jgi:ferredoxin-type protein NapF
MVSRRQFLRGDLSGKKTPLRPPGALPEAQFIASCNRCGDCSPACPAAILILDPAGYPSLDFSAGACRFCAECQAACPTGALPRDGSGRPWNLVARIGDDCLARSGVVCRSCGDSCEIAAIRFPLRLGGVSLPVVDATVCTGCGACVGVCPQQAVTIQAPDPTT